MKPLKVLIIGGGPTGSLIACMLKRLFNEKISIEVWDKARGVGGRMSTTRMNRNSSLTLDLGAQYISASREYQVKHKSIYDELTSNEVLTPLVHKIDGDRHNEDGTIHYVAPKGSSSIPKYFFNQSGSTMHSLTSLHTVNIKENHVSALGVQTTDDERKQVNTNADVVVLTLPIPQLLQMKGDIKQLIKKHRNDLEKVRYSSRFALGLFFQNIQELPGINWSAKYVKDDPCIRYVAVDTKKRNVECPEGISMVVHCSVPFSIKHLEKSFSQIQPIIEDHLYNIFPSLPKADSSKVIKWRYSQVSDSYVNQPGFLMLNSSPMLLVAGDAFTKSNFDGCVDSAEKVANYIMETHSDNSKI